MSITQQILDWLCTYPGWEASPPTLDTMGLVPGSAGLYYEGLHRRALGGDITGAIREEITLEFSLLYRLLPGQSPKLEAFARWVNSQSLYSKTPVPWDGEGHFCILADKAGIRQDKQTGTELYRVQLSVSYIKTHFKEVANGEDPT